jgi:predicted Zn-dependent peptidase
MKNKDIRIKMKFLFFIILIQGILMSANIKNITVNNIKIPIIFEKYSSLPIFNLQLVFKNSGYITDGIKSGLTNLTAKILNEGTLEEGAVKFARKLENKAISIYTSNGFETFVIEVSCLQEEYKTALKFLSQLLKDPNISQETLSKLKTLQISKLKQKENDFDYIASKELNKLIFKDTALENSSEGTPKSIEKITLKEIKNNINTIFNLNNLIIVAGGDIAFKDVKNSIMPIISHFKIYKSIKYNKIKVSTKIKTKIIKKDTKQAYIYFGSAFNLDSNDKNNYKAKIASFILGGSGFGSRLMEEIRVKRGLAYSAYGHIIIKKTSSSFTGHLQTKLQNQTKSKKLVKKIINDFVKNGVSQAELTAAKNFILGSQPLKTETFSQRQNRAFTLFYNGQKQSYPNEELKLIENLKLSDLNKFIKQHSEITNLSFSIVTK